MCENKSTVLPQEFMNGTSLENIMRPLSQSGSDSGMISWALELSITSFRGFYWCAVICNDANALASQLELLPRGEGRFRKYRAVHSSKRSQISALKLHSIS